MSRAQATLLPALTRLIMFIFSSDQELRKSLCLSVIMLNSELNLHNSCTNLESVFTAVSQVSHSSFTVVSQQSYSHFPWSFKLCVEGPVGACYLLRKKANFDKPLHWSQKFTILCLVFLYLERLSHITARSQVAHVMCTEAWLQNLHIMDHLSLSITNY